MEGKGVDSFKQGHFYSFLCFYYHNRPKDGLHWKYWIISQVDSYLSSYCVSFGNIYAIGYGYLYTIEAGGVGGFTVK